MRIRPISICLAVLSLSAFAADSARLASLITNGDFSLDSKGAGWPDDWGKPVPGITWEAEGGKRFLRLVSQSPGQMLMAYREVPLPAGTKGVEFAIRYRTAGVQHGSKPWFDARTIFHFLDSNRNNVRPDPKPLIFSPKSAEWAEVNGRVLVPEGALVLQTMPALFQVAAGTLDLAEVRVTPMSDSDAEAMAAGVAAAKAEQAERTAILDKELAMPPITPELKVSGNQLVTADGKFKWLQGLCVDSMQWSQGESVLWSIWVAIDEWKANVIRLPVHDTFWFGRGKGQPDDGEAPYRELVDKAVKLAAAKGVYLVLDLHQFGAPTKAHVAFWKDAAERYKNNPAVLFEIFNEPHGLSWEIWRNGGELKGLKNKVADVNPVENTQKTEAETTTGVQALVKAVRETGAKNMIIAGGLDWAYDLSGIMNGFALDDLGGNGIMYVSHIYPWKKDWQGKVLVAVDKHPVIITEIGCPRDYKDFAFISEPQRYPLEGWSENVLGMIQKYKIHWTGFSFHPHCGPPVIQDWNYTPTPYWGVYVKDALGGKQFEMREMR